MEQKASNTINPGLFDFPRRPIGEFDGCFSIKGIIEDSIIEDLNKIKPRYGKTIESIYDKVKGAEFQYFVSNQKILRT